MKNKLFNLIFLISIFVLKASAQSDIVQITPDQYIKCLSNPTFQFTNSTIKQCDTVGVNAVRFEYWNFGDHWNLGHDSIIDWTAWFTPNTYSITYPTAGNYNILLIDSSSCGRDSVTLTVTLINNPVAQVTSSNPVACKNGSVTINNSSSTGYSYQINSGIDAAYLPAIIGNNSIQFDSSGTFTVSLVAFFIGADTSCFDTSKVNVTILELPQPSFSISLSNQCDSAVANFSDASLNAVSWNWNFGNGNVATTQIVQSQTYTFGIYNVSLTVIDANNCQNEFVDTIKIYTSPTANFNGVNVCYNQTSIFTDQSIDFNNDTIQQWIWNFGDGNGSSNQNTTHVFAAAGSYDVQLIINTIYCTDTINQTIEVYPLPTSFFNTNVNTGCSPLQVDFTNSSSGASTYNWNFGDGNSTLVSNPTHIFVASLTDTIYNVELIAITSFGCRDTILNSISVSGKPIANFSVLNDTVCSGNSVIFTNLSQGNSSNSWNLGNGNVSALPNPITIYTNSSFTQSQINPIQLIIENINTCKDTFELNLVVLPEISASFNVDTLFCSNETALFTNTSVGATNYVWNFGDGTTSTISNPQHNFQNIGTGQLPYTVNLVASSSFGCKDSISKVCYVLAGPEASFVASPQIQTYPSAIINIFNSTVNASLYTINWNFGDGQTTSTAFPNQHTYNTWGNYIITLSVQNGECTDVLKDTIEILPPLPIAGFNAKKQGCKPLSVSFLNNSQYENAYTWKFGDGQTSTAENPTHTFLNAGTYDVLLIVSGPGGTDSIIGIDSIVVYDKPIAQFTATPLEVNIETEPVVITNQSTCSDGTIITYYYNFGDNTNSTQSNPVHTYKKIGEYQISLIVTSNKGCKDTFEFGQLIKVDETISIVVPNAFTPNTQSPNQFGFYDPYATNNDIFHPVVKGMTEFELSIYSRWGELLFESKDPKSGWDGYFRGTLCQQDVYIWKIKAIGKDKSEYNKTGDFLLIR